MCIRLNFDIDLYAKFLLSTRIWNSTLSSRTCDEHEIFAPVNSSVTIVHIKLTWRHVVGA